MTVEVGGEQIPLSIDGHGGEPAVEGAENVQGERARNRPCGKVKCGEGARVPQSALTVRIIGLAFMTCCTSTAISRSLSGAGPVTRWATGSGE